MSPIDRHTPDALSQELARIFAQAPVAICVHRGMELVYELVNERYQRFAPGRLLVGRPYPEALPELEGQGIFEVYREVIRSGVPFFMPAYPATYDRDGDGRLEDALFDVAIEPLRDAAGVVTGAITVATEVTELVSAQRAAEEAVRRMRVLQEVTEQLAGAVTIDQVGQVVIERGLEATGADGATVMLRARHDPEQLEIIVRAGTPSSLPGRGARIPLDTLAPVPHAVRTGEALWIESAEGLERAFPDPVFLRRARMTRHAAWVVLPFGLAGDRSGGIFLGFDRPRRFDDGEREYLLTFARQCALAFERARLLEAERAARAEAEAASTAKSDFLAVMSHELRTPLNAIGGYAELMAMGIHGPVSDDQNNALERIQRNQRHLLGLINEVLSFARVEAGSMKYSLSEVPVSEALGEVEALVAPQAQGRGIELSVLAGGDERVLADEDRLRQILVNLLGNALKFTPPGGRIWAECEVRDGRVAMHVHDTGIGIPADRLEQIFEPFVQVESGLTREGQGVGLGLAISRELARGMGGDLTAASEPGAGSTFTLVLPRPVG